MAWTNLHFTGHSAAVGRMLKGPGFGLGSGGRKQMHRSHFCAGHYI